MALPMTLAELYEAGDAWLADCSAHPDRVRQAWNAEALAPITTGEHWLVAESRVSTGLPAVARIDEEQRGPVLVDAYGETAWWLVSSQAAEELADVRQLRVQTAGWVLHCPPLGVMVAGHFWLWRPDGSGHLNDPAVLAAAFAPGGRRLRTEAL
ncbi:hypothetical protein [Streptomyces sp. NPDC093984]|uniref:hypothetical protein n=1 Tax=Streptomyces sp. NPDC093984 TaxID=3366052 RepID=UPI00382C0076